MISTAEIKTIRSLKDKKFRDSLGMFVVEGEKMVQEAIDSSFEVVKVYDAASIGENAMSRISFLSSPSPVLALVRKPADISQIPEISASGTYLALDGIKDPGNMGTILRIADWYGLDGVFAAEGSVDIFNPKVVQSTMGAIFRVDFHYCKLEKLLRRDDICVYGTFLEGENIYDAVLDRCGARFIVIGNESAGISDEVAALCSRRITIPSFARGAGSESLNAAVATAITVSEFKRRGL